ncbi:LacI family DNA-binding transcriptional regulator [Schaalia suimastitidis]|uniref:LacI family DNA-binding transcriptional regulator n=1 Tax=Schaalia suimastitidis TaxID=121163 RepID=UPI0003FAD9BD|nr:LacI family DNA-binding transcriptional regulator [Schaalia suimastitidis]
MSKTRTRLTDIARHAGVSTATVSRVINETGQVSDDTRHRVLVAIDSLGYERPSHERAHGSRTVGIIVPELTNPVFAAFTHAMELELSRAGTLPLVCTQTPGGTSEEDYVNELVARGVAGIVFISGRHANYRGDLTRYHHLSERHIPFVTINGARKEISAPDFSTADNIGIHAAVNHLVNLGHRNIALLGGYSHIIPAERKVNAFCQAMKEFLDITDPVIVETFYTYEAAAAATKQLATQGVTGIICGSDLQALGAIRTLHSLGLSIPGDISVIGFDDTMLMAHMSPPLTTIRQPIAAITTAAVRALFNQINDANSAVGHFEYTPDLIVRGSTGIAPAHQHSI